MATMGRRPKAEELKLTERITFKTTPELKAQLQALATGRGVDMSDLVRELIERELADGRGALAYQIGLAALQKAEELGLRLEAHGATEKTHRSTEKEGEQRCQF